jgi:hypothetical protein
MDELLPFLVRARLFRGLTRVTLGGQRKRRLYGRHPPMVRRPLTLGRYQAAMNEVAMLFRILARMLYVNR